MLDSFLVKLKPSCKISMNTAYSPSSLNLPLFYMVPVAGDKGVCEEQEYQRRCFVLALLLSPASSLACLCIFLMQLQEM